MNILEIIRKRKSSRTYKPTFLSSSDKEILKETIVNYKPLLDHRIQNLQIIEKNDEKQSMKLDYGMITGHNTYLLGIAESSVESRVNYGYVLEKVLLKATELGISSCWIGYFDETFFNEIKIDNGFETPAIVILGHSVDKTSNLEKFMRFAVKASKRLDREKLFFDYNTGLPLSDTSIPGYEDLLEMVRLAPSSGNTQPWRIFYDETSKAFHFYKKPINRKYEEKGLHDIDLGIAIAHFELASEHNNLQGSWFRNENTDNKEGMTYIVTWRML